MISAKAAITAMLIPAVFLSGCKRETPPEELHVSGAKSAVAFMHIIAKKSGKNNRPSGPLGIFTGLYLAQGVFLPVESAEAGMESVTKILMGQTSSSTDENFALLREIGDILQINVPDMLNRSTNRTEALDDYTQSLHNAGVLIERKLDELSALHDTQKTKEKEERKTVRDIERNLRTALGKPDYQAASEYEEQLTNAKVVYAEISTKAEQTDDMIERFETLLEIAAQRIRVVEHNREVLIAGLRVINMPGIAVLNILEKGRTWRKKRGSRLFDKPLTN